MKTNDGKLTSLAVAVYRLLLHMYPAAHREQFGEQIVQLFRDRLRTEVARDSVPALVDFARQSGVDLVLTAAAERIRTRRTLQLLLIPLSLLAGYLIYRVDSSPNWDDTGITAAALLLTAALFAFLQPRLAWLSAFTVGAWIPVAYFLKNGDPRILFVFFVPALGALAGAGARKVLGLITHPA